MQNSPRNRPGARRVQGKKPLNGQVLRGYDTGFSPAQSQSPFSVFSPRLVLVGFLVLFVIIGIVVFSCSRDTTPEEPLEQVNHRVSFVAVGDNVPNDILGEYADAQAGSKDDGTYDYTSLFAGVAPRIQQADLAYMVQETHVGGDDIGPKGYPSFNTTDEMADAVVETGFDLIASATNHSFDWGYYDAVEHSRAVWNTKPVAFSGTATSWNEAYDIPIVERNGITFALLSYTYGLNGFEPGDIEGYYVNIYSEERLRNDLPRARAQADVVIVAMHWGIEYETSPSEEELEYAQLLAELGADVVIGSHPHAIQPMTWLSGEAGHKTLVCYSLGNFIMQHTEPTHYTNLEGMLSCDFVRNTETGLVDIENVAWVPLVFHDEVDAYGVWPLSEYTDAAAAKNPAYKDLPNAREWMLEETAKIVNSKGDTFPIEGIQEEESESGPNEARQGEESEKE